MKPLPSERIYYDGLATRLATLRALHGHTKSSLARQPGLCRRNIQKWEAGDQRPSLYQIGIIARALNMTTSELLAAPLPEAGE